ncbi:MAG: flagellar biosynthetic protein FliR, partial [Deltaproteobacteria bacterium]|nr:flagellar biosynthetic protein FliR [Deltaproteobacteria bacterium]
GMQMGFAVANVLDPQTNSQLSVVAQFYNLLAILLFFALNIHLAFITAIKESFEYIAPYTFSLNRGVVEGLFLMAGNIFAIAVKLAAPVMVTILLANIAMGVLARTVPQLNIFVVGFPITIALGLVIVGITLPFAMELIEKVYGELTFSVIDLARSGGR